MAEPEQDDVVVQLRRRLETLRGRDLTDAEVEAEVRHLLAVGQPAIPVILEQFTGDDEALLAVATQTLKAWQEPRPVEALIRLLRSPNVDALAKGLILIILEKYELDVNTPEVFGVGINLEDYPLDISGGGNVGTYR